MIDTEALFTHYVQSYNKVAKRDGLAIYADPPPLMKLSDLSNSDVSNYMTDVKREKFRADFFHHMIDTMNPLAEMGFNSSASQRKKAKNKRGKIGDGGETLNEIIVNLADQHNNEMPREIWPHLFSKLQELGVNPSEVPYATDSKKRKYRYDTNSPDKLAKTISFGRFETVISTHRNKEKSR